MPIYDRSTKALMHEFATTALSPGRVFEKKQAIDWFGKHYPKIKPNTLAMHVEGMAVNSGIRKHHRTIKPGSGHDLFYKVGPGRFRLWSKETDPAPFYPSVDSDPNVDFGSETELAGDEMENESAGEFAYERDLRNYLAKNLNLIEPGLRLFEDEEFSGIEYAVGGRAVDILAVDPKGGFLVIELKVSRGYDRTVGQILRYMNWVKQNLAASKPVRGVIIARKITEDLKLAALLIPDVRLIEYELTLKLHPLNEAKEASRT